MKPRRVNRYWRWRTSLRTGEPSSCSNVVSGASRSHGASPSFSLFHFRYLSGSNYRSSRDIARSHCRCARSSANNCLDLRNHDKSRSVLRRRNGASRPLRPQDMDLLDLALVLNLLRSLLPRLRLAFNHREGWQLRCEDIFVVDTHRSV